MDYAIFRKNLTELIKNRYGSKAAFADLTGIPRPSMSRYCSSARVPDLDNVIRIAQVANVSLDWLLGLSTNQFVDGDVQEFASLYSIANESDKAIVKAILNKYRKE